MYKPNTTPTSTTVLKPDKVATRATSTHDNYYKVLWLFVRSNSGDTQTLLEIAEAHLCILEANEYKAMPTVEHRSNEKHTGES